MANDYNHLWYPSPNHDLWAVGPDNFHSKLFCVLCELQISDKYDVLRARICPPMIPVDEPYFPFLQPIAKNGPFSVTGDYVSLCRFCSALLHVQWNSYEKMVGEERVKPEKRLYHMHTFTCSVCGIETFRKKVKALPLAEFPFLFREKKMGSICIPLRDHTMAAVVCQDCFNCLNVQKLEYDRLRVPEALRKFNWVKNFSSNPATEEPIASTRLSNDLPPRSIESPSEAFSNLQLDCNTRSNKTSQRQRKLSVVHSPHLSSFRPRGCVTTSVAPSHLTYTPSLPLPSYDVHWMEAQFRPAKPVHPQPIPSQQYLTPTGWPLEPYTSEYFHHLYLHLKQTVCSSEESRHSFSIPSTGSMYGSIPTLKGIPNGKPDDMYSRHRKVGRTKRHSPFPESAGQLRPKSFTNSDQSQYRQPQCSKRLSLQESFHEVNQRAYPFGTCFCHKCYNNTL